MRELNKKQSAVQTDVVPEEPTNPLRNNDQTPWERPAPVSLQEQSPEAELPSSPPTGRPNTSKNSGAAFDPIKENGPIFEGVAPAEVGDRDYRHGRAATWSRAVVRASIG